jgi:hypothetical protein
MRILAGAWLTVLVSLVINDPRQPAPLAMSAVMVTFLILGKAAFGGARWLIRESPVCFPEGVNPIPPRDLAAKLVPWIGFGAGVPAAFLVTVSFLVHHRPPFAVGWFIGLVLYSFIPTLMVCLALLPLARSQAASSELLTERDRGVFPLALMLMVYAVGGYFFIYDNPFHHGFLHLIKHFVVVAFKSLLPYHWPQHVIAVAVACVVLRGWLTCTSGAVCGVPSEDAAAPQ